MKGLTKRQMQEIMTKGTISKRTKAEQEQIFEYAFGKEFMASEDKGALKTYRA